MPLPLLGLAAAGWFRCHLVWLFLPVRTRGTVSWFSGGMGGRIIVSGGPARVSPA